MSLELPNLPHLIDEILIRDKISANDLSKVLKITSAHLSHIRSGKVGLPRKKEFWNILCTLYDKNTVDDVYRRGLGVLRKESLGKKIEKLENQLLNKKTELEELG